MPECVPLESLPAELMFPSTLADRIWYDSDAKQLCFEGFMSKNHFDKLIRLSNDVDYQRAVDRLFQTCTFDDESSAESPAKTWLLAVAAAILATIGVGTLFLLR